MHEHILGFLKLDRLPLHFGSSPLCHGALLGSLIKNVLVITFSLFAHPSSDTVMNNTVDLKIRIPSDRRRKVTIILSCEPEVTVTGCRISCLLHGAKNDPADHRLRRLSFYRIQSILYLLRRNLLLRFLYADSLLSYKCQHVLDLLRVGITVNAVNKWNFGGVEVLGNGLIGSEHKVLNDPGCAVSFLSDNFSRNALLIQFYLGFRKIKVDSTAAHAPRPDEK